MLDLFAPIAAETRISVPGRHRRPIAVVGAGAIVDVAHLPAYRSHDLPVRGIYDLDRDRAEDVAARHGVPYVYASLDDLLKDDEVEVVDIAVVPTAQPPIARAALEAGKHLLCQKPLAPTLAEAREIAGLAEARGRRLAVNQQLRWDEGIAAARAMVRAGWIGTPTAMSFTVDVKTDWSGWPWLVRSERLEIMYHSIHYLDAVRSILGDPSRVFCAASRTPGQAEAGESRTMSTLLFDGGARAVLHVNHENRTGDFRAEFRIDGDKGAIRGTLGLLYDYPHGRPDTLEVSSSVAPTDGWVAYPVTERWIPGAFAGPMAGLLRWIAEDEPSPTAARDNLGTLALVEALYESIDSGEARPL
ncbi:gfo/Idh/MocA family oxidoreductase [Actinomadura sp. LD22]|uniref:Gfo/Idh/MocA family oxidoreductase n=1 Tax=Actinomadura physcomitrii TaxID=2650748 RepID=A0A6I4MCZ4_9ACTN|nr:Gfo/Idh/MocA family oxidoreductase [Actinomadura physcomitrii]MWA03573.1 gfo/Idh/MocA family oxidoreductase [Actinomadura physcomitrii]